MNDEIIIMSHFLKICELLFLGMGLTQYFPRPNGLGRYRSYPIPRGNNSDISFKFG